MLLVTTNHKLNSTLNEKVLFAGEWCKLYSEKKIWQNIEHETFPYHWINRKKLFNDIKNLETIYENYLKYLYIQLNNIHQVNFNKEYWRIIIGPWLQDFIELIFDYYETIKSIEQENCVTNTFITKTQWEDQVPQDITVFQESYSKSWYNHYLFGEIIKKSSIIPYTLIEENHPHVNKIISTTGNKSLKNKLKRGVKYICSFLYSSFLIPKKYKQITFISSYFNNIELKKIQKNLAQIPMVYLFDPIASLKTVNKKMRLLIELPNSENEFEILLNRMIPQHIPISYIENYKSYKHLASKYFPQDVLAIFTSNSYYFNESFKIWAAEETQKNAKLLISQHGGFGTSKWCQTEDHQIKISHKFYTWGWSSNNKTKKMPSNKLNYTKKLINHNPKGNILCVTTADIYNYQHTQNAMALESHFKEYVTQLSQIPKFLNEEIQSLFKFRLYHTDFNRGTWGMKDELVDLGLLQYIDSDSKNFYTRISECRLTIITYNPNATAFETLSANYPTLLFWNPEHWELRESAISYYKQLEDVGIFHSTIESLTKKIEEVYYNTDEWWNSKNVQNAVTTFCNEFAYTNDTCIQEWTDEFKSYLGE